MDSPTSHTPSPSPNRHAQFTSSGFTSPTISSTLPLPLTRPTSDSALFSRKSNKYANRDFSVHLPRRHRTRSAASSVGSLPSESNYTMGDFTIDLAKLGGSFRMQESAVTMPTRQLEPLESKDDGPPDFTMNLDKWMRGTGDWKKEHGEGEGEGETGIENENENESEFMPLSTSTPTHARGKNVVEEQTDEVGAEVGGLPVPSSTNLDTEAFQDQAAEEVFNQISALQAEVEKLRHEAEEHRSEKNALEQQYSLLEQDYDQIQSELQEARSLAKSLEQSATNIKEKALAKEELLRRDVGSRVGSLRAKFEPMAQELESTKADAEGAKIAADNKIKSLETELKQSQDETARYRNNVEDIRKTASDQVSTLRTELETCKSKLLDVHRSLEVREQDHIRTVKDLTPNSRFARKMETHVAGLGNDLQHAQEELSKIQQAFSNLEEEKDELEEAKVALKELEDENARLRKMNEDGMLEFTEMKSAYERTKSTSDEQKAELRKVEATIDKLNQDLQQLRSERNSSIADSEAHNSQLEELRAQQRRILLDQQQQHQSELKALKASISRAGDGMRKREERIQSSHKAELSSLQTQLTTLQHQATLPRKQAPAVESTTVTELRSAIRVLSSKLKATCTELKSARADLVAAREEVKEVRSVNEDVNRELEARFEALLEGREREWRQRVEELAKERKLMGRALMGEWGKREVGTVDAEGRVGYRYAFGAR